MPGIVRTALQCYRALRFREKGTALHFSMLNMCAIKSIACHHSPLDWINYIPQLGSTKVILLPYVAPKSSRRDRVHYRLCFPM